MTAQPDAQPEPTFTCGTCKTAVSLDEWCCDWCNECAACRRKAQQPKETTND